MTTTELIKLLQQLEHGASGRPREITIYKKRRFGFPKKILSENQILTFYGSGDGCAGAELELLIK